MILNYKKSQIMVLIHPDGRTSNSDWFVNSFVTNYYYGAILVINELHLASNESKSSLISGGWQQLFMGVYSCTGPMGRKELQTVMLDGELVMCREPESSSTFAVRMLDLRRIQTLSLDTVFIDYSWDWWIQMRLGSSHRYSNNSSVSPRNACLYCGEVES